MKTNTKYFLTTGIFNVMINCYLYDIQFYVELRFYKI